MSKGQQGTFDRGPSHPTALSRRGVLKGAAAATGAAAGNGLIGAPMVWAQELKDIALRHVGVSYSVVKEIGDQASKDLGFKVAMQNLDTSAAITRFITQPQFASTSPTSKAGRPRSPCRAAFSKASRSRRSSTSTRCCRSSPRASTRARKCRDRASRPMRRCICASHDATKIVEGVARLHDVLAAGLQREFDRLSA